MQCVLSKHCNRINVDELDIDAVRPKMGTKKYTHTHTRKHSTQHTIETKTHVYLFASFRWFVSVCSLRYVRCVHSIKYSLWPTPPSPLRCVWHERSVLITLYMRRDLQRPIRSFGAHAFSTHSLNTHIPERQSTNTRTRSLSLPLKSEMRDGGIEQMKTTTEWSRQGRWWWQRRRRRHQRCRRKIGAKMIE